MLTDDVVILVRGGSGGNGAVSFRRNGQTAKGGPDGGNGGKGANVYVEGRDDITLLSQFQYKKEIFGQDGGNGEKQNKYGKNGQDSVFYVPFGTKITDLAEGKSFDIEKESGKILIAKGGEGGRGNNEFKSSTVQAPRYRELGQKGEEKKLRLELKLIADVGLIGLPNVGKSSLLQALTNAHPKIGDYPFTTLEPNLGVLEHLIIADIPGLIKGASEGRGLGDKFLKHIEKTTVLLHCIDSTSQNLQSDYKTVRDELRVYNPALSSKRELVVLTKSDLTDKDKLDEKLEIVKKLNKNSTCVSVIDDKSVEILKAKILELIKK